MAVAILLMGFLITSGGGHADAANGGCYHATDPIRLLDTRQSGGPIGPGTQRVLKVGGVGMVPATAGAIAANVTVTDTTTASFLVVYPAGGSRPIASNLNWAQGQTIANFAETGLGNGDLSIYNDQGTADVVIDLAGWYDADCQGGDTFHPIAPARIADSRSGLGFPAGKINAGSPVSLQVTGRGNVPAQNVTAVTLNFTVDGATSSSYLAVAPAGSVVPATSNLNFSPGPAVANRAIARLSSSGQILVSNSVGGVDVIVDVSGWYGPDPGGGTFHVAQPTRIVDTRSGLGGYSGPLGPNSTQTFKAAGVAGVPATGVTAIVANLTGLGASEPTYVSTFPAGNAVPYTSDVNLGNGHPRPNHAVTMLSGDGSLEVYNRNGSVHLLVDLSGYFVGGAPTVPLPGAAVITSAAPASAGSLSVQWNAAPSQGSTVTSYEMTASPGGYRGWAVGQSLTGILDGLLCDADYTVTVRATNAAGSGPASAPSGNVHLTCPPPAITSISSRMGSSAGGTALVISGSGFRAGARVLFGGVDATIQSLGDGSISLTTPAHGPATVDVSVLDSDGQQATAAGAYQYVSARQLGAPFFAQKYTLDCESAALQMTLALEGINVNQDQLLGAEGVDARAPQWDSAGLHWGDPYAAFVGQPNGAGEGTSWGSSSGYGVYYPPIAAAARAYGGRVIQAGEGLAPSTLYNSILDGHPVVAWVPYGWTPRATSSYVAFDGRRVMYGAPWEHAVTVGGVTETDVLILDPHQGSYWIPRSEFEQGYAMFNQMAVILD